MEHAGETIADAEVRTLAAERLSFFADAVLAIAITLLALELPLPRGSTNAELLHSFGEHRSEYIMFLISFAVIGGHWRAHHRLFRYVKSVGSGLVRLTFCWLLLQVLTPFATKLLGTDGPFETRFVFYALVQLLALAMFLLMIRLARRDGLLRANTPPDLVKHSSTGIAVMATAFAVSIPVAFFTQWAYACWIGVPVLVSLVQRFLAGKRDSAVPKGQ